MELTISEAYFIFHLTPQQAQEIAMSRDLRPGTVGRNMAETGETRDGF
jgi:hypothetical protein